MHECFHNRGHRNPTMNWLLGFSASTIFGTAYSLFAINHYGHHVRNRTRAELVDYIYPDENGTKKTVLYYFAIVGGIWLGGLIGPFLCFVLPYSMTAKLRQGGRDNTYAEAFKDFTPAKWWLMRLETILAVSFWVVIYRALQWDYRVLLVTYAAFAFSWSSLQWVYHVRTPIHSVEGAYNLRAPWLVRVLFLNFNYNLTHHRDSGMPWQEMFRRSNQQETQPLWYRYVCIFLPPQPLPEDPSVIQKTYF